MFTVYALYSPNHQKIYIGYTSNMEERLNSHNFLANKGFTIKFRPWEIVFQENHQNKKDAMRREKQLKSAKGRKFIWNIIQKKYP